MMKTAARLTIPQPASFTIALTEQARHADHPLWLVRVPTDPRLHAAIEVAALTEPHLHAGTQIAVLTERHHRADHHQRSPSNCTRTLTNPLM